MGSFKFFEAFLLYKGTLYNVEGWDRDYQGDCWESNIIENGLLYSEIPLIIPTKQLNKEDLIQLIVNGQSFKNIVKDLAKRKIISYVDRELCRNALYSNFPQKFQIYNKYTFDKVKLICNLLRIDKDKMNLLNGKEIILICSEFILINGEEKYETIFFDEIEDMTLSLQGKTQIAFKDGSRLTTEVTAKQLQHPKTLKYYKTLIRYY